MFASNSIGSAENLNCSRRRLLLFPLRLNAIEMSQIALFCSERAKREANRRKTLKEQMFYVFQATGRHCFATEAAAPLPGR